MEAMIALRDDLRLIDLCEAIEEGVLGDPEDLDIETSELERESNG